MCDCAGWGDDPAPCCLSGCYCNRDAAAAAARASGLLVRCGGGLPCACALASASAGAAGADPLGASLGPPDPAEPAAVSGSVAAAFGAPPGGHGVDVAAAFGYPPLEDEPAASFPHAMHPALQVPPLSPPPPGLGDAMQKPRGGGVGGCCGPRADVGLEMPAAVVGCCGSRADAGVEMPAAVAAAVQQPSKRRRRCGCHGEGGLGCSCGPGCACPTADVEMASNMIVALSGAAGSPAVADATTVSTHAEVEAFDALGAGGWVAASEAHADHAEEDLGLPAIRGLKRELAFVAPVPAAAPGPRRGSCCGSKAGARDAAPLSPRGPAHKPAAAAAQAAKPGGRGPGPTVCSSARAQRRTGRPRTAAAADGRAEDRPFACEEPGCLATFVFKQNRDRHLIEVHQPERRPHTCEYPGCSAAFKNSSGLKQHKSTVHQRNRPFKCDQCSASFGQRNHLSQHTKAVHLGRRPFACTRCDARFSNRGNLNQHMRRRKHFPLTDPVAQAVPASVGDIPGAAPDPPPVSIEAPLSNLSFSEPL